MTGSENAGRENKKGREVRREGKEKGELALSLLGERRPCLSISFGILCKHLYVFKKAVSHRKVANTSITG